MTNKINRKIPIGNLQLDSESISIKDRKDFLSGAQVKVSSKNNVKKNITVKPNKLRSFMFTSKDEERLANIIERMITNNIRPVPTKTDVIRKAIELLDKADLNICLNLFNK